jgi:hypothetical protein
MVVVLLLAPGHTMPLATFHRFSLYFFCGGMPESTCVGQHALTNIDVSRACCLVIHADVWSQVMVVATRPQLTKQRLLAKSLQLCCSAFFRDAA